MLNYVSDVSIVMESQCPLCLSSELDVVEHLEGVCEYNVAPVSAVFRESIPSVIEQLGKMPADEVITAKDLYTTLLAVIERQDKLAMILQFRTAKLASRAAGIFQPCAEPEDDPEGDPNAEPKARTPTRWADV